MSVDEYFTRFFARFVSAVDESITSVSVQLENDIRRRVPGNRRKTRNAVEYRKSRQSATRIRTTLRLRFVQSYNAAGTVTQQVWYRAWDKTRPEVRERFERILETHYDNI
jgi:hypothetical protein